MDPKDGLITTDTLLLNGTNQGCTSMGKAGLLSSPKRGLVQVTDRGRALLSEKPARVDNTTLGRYPEFIEWVTGTLRKPSKPIEIGSSQANESAAARNDLAPSQIVATPRERIDQAMGELEAALRSDLLERTRAMTPSEFEGLILSLLLAMGYGQGLDEMAVALGGTGDGGIDGVLHQDPLGLDRVYIQAKRYKEGSGVSSPDIRNFIGALNINRANKGVFVTASHFTNDARHAAQGSTIQVVLIDGERLAELMVRYKVGALARSSIEIKEVDEGFFAN